MLISSFETIFALYYVHQMIETTTGITYPIEHGVSGHDRFCEIWWREMKQSCLADCIAQHQRVHDEDSVYPNGHTVQWKHCLSCLASNITHLSIDP